MHQHFLSAAAAGVAGLVYTSREFTHLFDIYVPIALGVFAAIVLIVGAAVVVYRRRPVERAGRWSEHNRIEGAYALLLACTVVFLLYLTFRTEHRVEVVANAEKPSLVIDVYGQKWEWHFDYPGYGINRYSGTVGHETLVVPTNEAIRFRLISLDVIHEFWIPALRYKHDLIPGSTQEITLSFEKPGVYPGQCAEFCGLYHSRMTFTAVAESPARFAAWAQSARRHPSLAAGTMRASSASEVSAGVHS